MTPEQHAYIFQQAQRPEFVESVVGIWDKPMRAWVIRTAAEHKYVFGHVPSPGFPPAGKVLLVPRGEPGRVAPPLSTDWSSEPSDPIADIQAGIAAAEARARAPKPRLVTEEQLAAASIDFTASGLVIEEKQT